MASIIRSVFGPSTPEAKPSGKETILKLSNRATSSTLLDDRRDAFRAIKGMSRQYRRDVGDVCLDILLQAIEKERGDSETVGYAVEAILNVISTEEGEEGTDELMIGPEYATKVVESENSIPLLLGLIEEYDFQIRRPTVRLLTSLLFHCLPDMQEVILHSPMGISKIMDLLVDSREVIRNDALLLVLELTRSNSQIQKIVAFENAFERLMSIVHDEGLSDGGIIVLDCITVMHNLLNNNASNQSFYREASQIQSLVPFFDFKLSSSTVWSDQKVQNILHMLRLIRILVSPRNSQQNTVACQKIMYQCRLLPLLCNFMFAGGVKTEILIESINTVAEVIRGDLTNQQFFDTVTTPSQPPRPGILTILMCMVNEKQSLPLRLAALYCFQCYLYKNEVGQTKVVNTLLPSSTENAISAGQILCAGLFGNDQLSNWMTAVALSGALNSTLKPQLLRVQVSMQGKGQVTLLQQCSNILVERADLRPLSRIGLLILMCTWMAHCPGAVAQFLGNTVNIPFLTGMVENTYNNEHDKTVGGLCAMLVGICLAFNDGNNSDYHPEIIRQIIMHRITKETFLQSLSQTCSSEFFITANKHPQIMVSNVGQLCFDHAFTVLFKTVSETVHKALDPSYTPDSLTASTTAKDSSQTDLQHSFEEHTSIVHHYKELLQEQDEEINFWKKKCDELEAERYKSKNPLPTSEHVDGVTLANGSSDSVDEISRLRETNISFQRLQESLKLELSQKNVQLEKVRQEFVSATSDAQTYKDRVIQLKADNEALLTDNNSLDSQLQALQKSEPISIGSEVASPVVADTSETDHVIANLKQKLSQMQLENDSLNDKIAVISKEQEDLLVFLADSDSKIKKYRSLLVANNVELGESEESDSDEDTDDEDL